MVLVLFFFLTSSCGPSGSLLSSTGFSSASSSDPSGCNTSSFCPGSSGSFKFNNSCGHSCSGSSPSG